LDLRLDSAMEGEGGRVEVGGREEEVGEEQWRVRERGEVRERAGEEMVGWQPRRLAALKTRVVCLRLMLAMCGGGGVEDSL